MFRLNLTRHACSVGKFEQTFLHILEEVGVRIPKLDLFYVFFYILTFSFHFHSTFDLLFFPTRILIFNKNQK